MSTENKKTVEIQFTDYFHKPYVYDCITKAHAEEIINELTSSEIVAAALSVHNDRYNTLVYLDLTTGELEARIYSTGNGVLRSGHQVDIWTLEQNTIGNSHEPCIKELIEYYAADGVFEKYEAEVSEWEKTNDVTANNESTLRGIAEEMGVDCDELFWAWYKDCMFQDDYLRQEIDWDEIQCYLDEVYDREEEED